VSDLFRREALDAQRTHFHGAIVLSRSPARAAWTVAILLLLAGLAAIVSTQGFARQHRVRGVLLPAAGLVRLVAPQAGVVLAGGPAQGEAVAAGALMLRLATGEAAGQARVQAAVAESLLVRQQALKQELGQQQTQARQQATALDARIASAEAGLEPQARELALQRERLGLLREVAARYPELVRTGAVSPVEASEKAAEVIEQQARLAGLERERLALRRDIDALRAERAALPLQAGREGLQLQRQMQALAQTQAETRGQQEAQVLAPQAGRVAARLVDPGQPVAAGQTLATLLPAGSPLEAELLLPSRAAAGVRPGQPVRLRVDAWPHARYGQLRGHVREVTQSGVPVGDAAALMSPVAAGGVGDAQPGTADTVYRLRVSLDPLPPGPTGDDAGPLPETDPRVWALSLKAGMQVQATLAGEHRTLLQWAFEPLLGLREAWR